MKAPHQRKVRKSSAGLQPKSQWIDIWGDGQDYDVGEGSALEAIREGDDTVLIEYLRHADKLSPKVLRVVSAMLNPNSSHTWRLHLNRRNAGNPDKSAKAERYVTDASVFERICKKPMRIKTAREIAEMLDSESRHQFRLWLRKRTKGPIAHRRLLDTAILFAVRKTLKTGHPIESLVSELRAKEGISRKTFFEYKKAIEARKTSSKNIRRTKANNN